MNKRQKTILLIDDDPCFSNACKSMLKSLGHKIIIAYSAEEALAKILQLKHGRDEIFDILMVDQNMEGMSGINFLAFYKEIANENIPTIMVSNEIDPGLAEKAKSAGAMTFISKPITNKPSFLKIIDSFIT